jgi:hypothetical protein
MKEKIRDIYHLSIFPLTTVVVLIINILVIKNTPDHELFTMTEEEYVERTSTVCEDTFYKPLKTVLDILATISWGLIINWLFL